MRNDLTLFKKDPFIDTMDDVFGITPFRSSFFDSLDNLFNKYSYNDYPKIKINKNESDYQLIMGIPGLTKDDLKISIKDGLLSISFEKEEKNDNSYFMRSFEKSYVLPDDVSQDKIEASVKDGILLMKLPFYEKKPKEKVINIE